MKKIIITISVLLLTLCVFSQEKKSKTIVINSRTMIAGGNYTLIPGTLGRTTEIESLSIKYDFNTTAYTVSGTDSVLVQTLTNSGSIEDILYIEDGVFQSTIKSRIVSPKANASYGYGNSIYLDIPTSKFTLGDSDIIITIDYSLNK